MTRTALVFAVLLVSSTAHGQPEVVAEDVHDGGYTYNFKDADRLIATGSGADGAILTVRRVGLRERLLRPRLHFVQQMLKTAEAL